jgi:hypothetical protein
MQTLHTLYEKQLIKSRFPIFDKLGPNYSTSIELFLNGVYLIRGISDTRDDKPIGTKIRLNDEIRNSRDSGVWANVIVQALNVYTGNMNFPNRLSRKTLFAYSNKGDNYENAWEYGSIYPILVPNNAKIFAFDSFDSIHDMNVVTKSCTPVFEKLTRNKKVDVKLRKALDGKRYCLDFIESNGKEQVINDMVQGFEMIKKYHPSSFKKIMSTYTFRYKDRLNQIEYSKIKTALDNEIIISTNEYVILPQDYSIAIVKFGKKIMSEANY